MDFVSLLPYITPPIAGAIIGYFTNDIAIKMLFRPYRPLYYMGNKQLPFTPGLIPKNQERLAKRVSDTIMSSLLTPGEIENLTKRLLHTERVQGALLWLLQLALNQFQSDTEQKTIGVLAGILKELFGSSLPRMLKVVARRDDFLEDQLNQIFDQVLLELRLSKEQARRLADWLLRVVVPPDIIRVALIDFLTDRNIAIIDERFREKTSGTYWVVANLFGLKNTLTRIRTFCLDDKEEANTRLQELIVAIGIRQRLQDFLLSLTLQNLPVATAKQLRKTMADTVRIYIRDSGTDMLQSISQSVDWENIAKLILNRLKNSSVMSSSLEVVSQELAIILEKHLEKDLENIVAQIIQILSLDQLIINRIKGTSPEVLEEAIEAIVKTELQAIVNLGGVLGLIVGILQVVFLYVTR